MCEVCVLCFSEDPLEDFSPRGVFFFFCYPRGDRFPQKIYIPPGANSEDIRYYGMSPVSCILNAEHSLQGKEKNQ